MSLCQGWKEQVYRYRDHFEALKRSSAPPPHSLQLAVYALSSFPNEATASSHATVGLIRRQPPASRTREEAATAQLPQRCH